MLEMRKEVKGPRQDLETIQAIDASIGQTGS